MSAVKDQYEGVPTKTDKAMEEIASMAASNALQRESVTSNGVTQKQAITIKELRCKETELQSANHLLEKRLLHQEMKLKEYRAKDQIKELNH